MARDEERQEADSESTESRSQPPEVPEGQADSPPVEPAGENEVANTTASDSEKPESEDPFTDSGDAPEGESSKAESQDTPSGEETKPEDTPPQKAKSKGTGKIWFVLLLILAAGGYFGWKGFLMLRGHQGSLASLNQQSNQLGQDIQKLRELVNQLPQKNAAQLEQLIARFEETQARIEDTQSRIDENNEAQRAALEALQREVDQLKEGVRIGTIQLQSTEEVPGAEGELEPVAGEVVKPPQEEPAEETPAGETEEASAEEPVADEETPVEKPGEAAAEETTPVETEETAEETALKETETGSGEPTDQVTPGAPEMTETEEELSQEESTESSAEETSVEETAPEMEEEPVAEETTMQEPEPQPEPTPSVETSEAPPQPEVSQQPEPTQPPETPRGPKRSEEAQSYIDFVEDSAAKAWGWVQEGSKKLWDSIKEKF
ncbi:MULTISPECIES: hypothetical protein [unclassified Nitrospina]|uniref:hypothetical protein n=1 Tax=unclassified Nitrospina TaxID=2638683 RepID=UPI003F9CFE5A